jgi:hypothetical protein
MSIRRGLVLTDPDASLQLDVLGYQFPGAAHEDGEWLVIAGRASIGDRTWEFRDPCLMISELVSLVAWLQGIAEGRVATKRRAEFLEPELAFEFERIGPSQVRLTVEMEFGAAPPWWDAVSGSGDGLVPFRMALEVTHDQLREAADGLAAAAPDVIARQAARGQFL